MIPEFVAQAPFVSALYMLVMGYGLVGYVLLLPIRIVERMQWVRTLRREGIKRSFWGPL